MKQLAGSEYSKHSMRVNPIRDNNIIITSDTVLLNLALDGTANSYRAYGITVKTCHAVFCLTVSTKLMLF